MFGLMRFRPGSGDYELWRLHYCGACKTIGRRYGQSARLLLNHDAVFLAELLTALQPAASLPSAAAYRSWNCARLPQDADIPPVLRFASAVTLLLSEYKLRDRALDSPRRSARWLRRVLDPALRKARRDLRSLGFPLEQCDHILRRQERIEAAAPSLRQAAAPTAEVTALVFQHAARLAGAPDLSPCGYRFGFLIYLLDAWEDFDRDAASGSFNALRSAGRDRAWAADCLRAEAEQLAALLPAPLGQRLRANLHARLRAPFRILSPCPSTPRPAQASRFSQALRRTRELAPSPWAFAAVLGCAFLFPLHARSVRSPSECLSLLFNLMALSGLLAVVAGTPEPKPHRLRSCCGNCCGGVCDSLDCSDCCDCGSCDCS